MVAAYAVFSIAFGTLIYTFIRVASVALSAKGASVISKKVVIVFTLQADFGGFERALVAEFNTTDFAF